MANARKQARKTRPPTAPVQRIIARLRKDHPDAKLDLDFDNPLQLLIALILAAQARDELVNQITRDLFAKYRTAEDYTRASPGELENVIRKINFYRNKARAIRNCCTEIVRRFDGRVPSEIDALLTLPGVGRKTANILLGNVFGRDTIGVDTHVLRLSQRLGLTRHTDPDKAESELMPLVPSNQRVRFCHLLQYHGRRVCFAKKPNCPQCSLAPLCPYTEKTRAQR